MHNTSFLESRFSFNNQDLLTDLPDSVCEPMKKNTISTEYEVGQSIFEEGNVPSGIYRVREGFVKKFTATNFGTEHIFYICSPREYLGYHALLSEELYNDSAVALTSCVIDFIPKKHFLEAIESSHTLSQRLLKKLSHEFVVFLNATKLLAKYTVRERAALNLLILAEKFKTKESVTEIKINRNDLSSMVGTAKESLVRMLKDYKEEELITTSGRSIFIKNYAGLLKVANIN